VIDLNEHEFRSRNHHRFTTVLHSKRMISTVLYKILHCFIKTALKLFVLRHRLSAPSCGQIQVQLGHGTTSTVWINADTSARHTKVYRPTSEV